MRLQTTSRLILLPALVLALCNAAAAVAGDSGFQGRRQIGGLHGPCGARMLVHLVAPDNRFAPGPERLVGLLLDASSDPLPLEVRFLPLGGSPVGPSHHTSLDGEAAITLLRPPPGKTPLLWHSSFHCDDAHGVLDIIYPAAETLLVREGRPQDRPLQKELQRLQAHCGGSVSRQWVIDGFGLDRSELPELPELPMRLPVRCP